MRYCHTCLHSVIRRFGRYWCPTCQSKAGTITKRQRERIFKETEKNIRSKFELSINVSDHPEHLTRRH